MNSILKKRIVWVPAEWAGGLEDSPQRIRSEDRINPHDSDRQWLGFWVIQADIPLEGGFTSPQTFYGDLQEFTPWISDIGRYLGRTAPPEPLPAGMPAVEYQESQAICHWQGGKETIRF